MTDSQCASAAPVSQAAESSAAAAAVSEDAQAPSQSSRVSRKRPRDDLSLLCELPPAEAEAVSLALEQWGRLRHRVKALEPTLRREGALVQEILDTGLRDENRRTLRKLTQSSAGGDVEETIQQVGKAIGANRERLERILERNHGELVRLSTTAVSDMKEDVLREVDEVLARLKQALASVRGELLGAKERMDMAEVRRTGRSFNDLKGLVRRLDEERRLITRNSALAALLVTVCRRVLPVRQVDPSALRDIPPSFEGYRRIMDFYFFTDAGLYFFGDYPSGPNWFVRLKRNVAILLVRNNRGDVVFNHFAVSGEHRAPGAPLAPDAGPLLSMDAQDEHGRVFNRQHDAEFKLLSGFCEAAATWTSEGDDTTAGGSSSSSAGASTSSTGSSGSSSASERGNSDETMQPESGSTATSVSSAAATCAASSRDSRASSWEGSGTLWSRKPLCASCLGAVAQVRQLFPRLRLTVSVGVSPVKGQKPGHDRLCCFRETEILGAREAAQAEAEAAAPSSAASASGSAGGSTAEAAAGDPTPPMSEAVEILEAAAEVLSSAANASAVQGLSEDSTSG
eukprot:TRINITY_DN2437_c0_g1_i1.p1 TRINITY_DN2437_c0_g1~~TRINITY_DN2437_c0_g1_i1.p1  ORF type:complete len:577 (+),score=125.16 TRINITY_DN2437_c0_g1_i1:25-1731(+)